MWVLLCGALKVTSRTRINGSGHYTSQTGTHDEGSTELINFVLAILHHIFLTV